MIINSSLNNSSHLEPSYSLYALNKRPSIQSNSLISVQLICLESSIFPCTLYVNRGARLTSCCPPSNTFHDTKHLSSGFVGKHLKQTPILESSGRAVWWAKVGRTFCWVYDIQYYTAALFSIVLVHHCVFFRMVGRICGFIEII